LDEIKIKELQEKNVLADVSISPIKFVHGKKENFRKIFTDSEEVVDAFEVAQAEYKNEAMYLSQYEKTNKIIVNLAKNVIKQHNNWNTLILFDYTSSGESLFSLLDWENKHYIDGQVKLETRTDIVDKMNDPNGGQITIANCKCFGTGITVKNIQCIILVTSQSSVTKVIQAIGRRITY
jgi:superfamily II DNA or RNA helicase